MVSVPLTMVVRRAALVFVKPSCIARLAKAPPPKKKKKIKSHKSPHPHETFETKRGVMRVRPASARSGPRKPSQVTSPSLEVLMAPMERAVCASRAR